MGLLFGTLFALGAAIGPGMLLRGKGIDVTKWIAYSAVAGAIGAASGFVLFFTFLDPDTVPEILTSLILGLFIGLPMGIAQWLVLRKGGEGTTIWPVIVTTAFVAGFTIGIPLGEDGQEWISLSAIGLFAGAITALGAVWLLGSKQTAVSA
jgi:predicted MFS family arabinose efflux permease